MAARAFITGLAGSKVSPNERAFLHEARPWGLIIFQRNVSTPAQVTELIQSFRDIVGWDAPVLVDQEGGRVQRLGPPNWPAYPPGQRYGELYDREPASGLAAARLAGHLIAADLRPLGIDVDCLPIADVPLASADPVIGDRAYGTEPGKVAAIAKAIARGSAGRRRSSGTQASAGPWPRRCRQPSQAAGGRYRPRDPRGDRFRCIPAAGRLAARHDRTCCVYCHRPSRARHHFGHNGAGK